MNTGLDPEVLVLNGDSVVPASRFLGPPERDEQGVLNQLSYDNAAIEMRPTHADRVEDLTKGLGVLFHTAHATMRLARRKGQIPSKSKIKFIPAAHLSEADRELETVSRFGCSPSILLDNDYASRNVIPLRSGGETLVRSAGFHIHQEIQDPESTQAVVAVLDGFLGLLDVMMNHRNGWDDASRLRRLHLGYGRAGEHRIRRVTSGALVLEYRSLSPWPLSNPEYIKSLLYTVRTISNQSADTLLTVLNDFPDRKEITSAIDTSNYRAAARMIRQCRKAWRTHVGPTKERM